MATYPKKLNGLCIGVLSGDRVLFQGPPDKENGGYKQKILHLTAIVAPKVDTANGKDEKFGYASREFLRTRLVGKNPLI
jgi:staphylococcal nuclease domain-containing protein 1